MKRRELFAVPLVATVASVPPEPCFGCNGAGIVEHAQLKESNAG